MEKEAGLAPTAGGASPASFHPGRGAAPGVAAGAPVGPPAGPRRPRQNLTLPDGADAALKRRISTVSGRAGSFGAVRGTQLRGHRRVGRGLRRVMWVDH